MENPALSGIFLTCQFRAALLHRGSFILLMLSFLRKQESRPSLWCRKENLDSCFRRNDRGGVMGGGACAIILLVLLVYCSSKRQYI